MDFSNKSCEFNTNFTRHKTYEAWRAKTTSLELRTVVLKFGKAGQNLNLQNGTRCRFPASQKDAIKKKLLDIFFKNTND